VRQFFTLRYWLTLLALGGLALGVMVLTSGSDEPVAVTEGSLPGDVPAALLHVDLMTPVYLIQAPDGLGFVDGRLTADIALFIDGTRTMVIKAGTPGANSCVNYLELVQCVVAADLLGDAVLRFEIIPAAFATTYPALDALNVMHLATPSSAILSAVIFNTLIIVALIPLALKIGRAHV
jgi:hypothetical protein